MLLLNLKSQFMAVESISDRNSRILTFYEIVNLRRAINRPDLEIFENQQICQTHYAR
jgi:hypothetical protein